MSLTTDIAELRKIGEYHLPFLAQQLGAAADTLAAIDTGAENLFVSPGTRGTEKSAARAEWIELFALVHQVIADSCVNLRDVGIGTVNAANAFAEQDTTNATSLDAVDDQLQPFYDGTGGYDEHVKPGEIADPVEADITVPTETDGAIPVDGESVAVE